MWRWRAILEYAAQISSVTTNRFIQIYFRQLKVMHTATAGHTCTLIASMYFEDHALHHCALHTTHCVTVLYRPRITSLCFAYDALCNCALQTTHCVTVFGRPHIALLCFADYALRHCALQVMQCVIVPCIPRITSLCATRLLPLKKSKMRSLPENTSQTNK